MSLFEVSGLSKSFGGLAAITDLDLQVEEGEIVSVIGPNGAGKTTLFNLITGFYPIDEGAVTFDGRDLIGLSPDEVTKTGIARTFQTVRLFRNMTVLENVMVALHSRSKGSALGAILRTPRYRREVAAFFREHPVKSGERALRQSLERFDWYRGFRRDAARDLTAYLSESSDSD